ncbi:MAG: DNA polymerase Y family protein [Parvularculaceae bacterium]|nr:DNA polymerase Y family protein [Parvularculaceae bacterium]
MRRYLVIKLIDWPLTRWQRAQAPILSSPDEQDSPPTPLAMVEKNQHGLRVVCANATARSEGVANGLPFTDARARCPAIGSVEVDRTADAKVLKKLAHWMVVWTPLVMVDGIDALILDTTGCDHLHGGEEAMMQAMAKRLYAADIPHSMGMAGTVGAAYSLALTGGGHFFAGDEKAGLKDLPLEALRISGETLTLLRRFGLTRIGQLYGLDRSALKRRFPAKLGSDAVMLRLDQALGNIREPLNPLLPQPQYAARLACAEPLLSSDGVKVGLEKLIHQLAEHLGKMGQGAQRFTLHAFRTDGTSALCSIATARPERKVERINHLFQERVETIDPEFGIDALLLTAHRAGAMTEAVKPLSADMAGDDFDLQEVAQLADKLNARLGDGAVQVRRAVESHVPERAEVTIPFEGELPRPLIRQPKAKVRPLTLFPRPEAIEVLAAVPDGPPMRFVWRKVSRRVKRTDGPERIAPEWWKLTEKGARARDYYRVEDESGRRYWVFRDGLYDDGRGGPPQWFIHGLFP